MQTKLFIQNTLFAGLLFTILLCRYASQEHIDQYFVITNIRHSGSTVFLRGCSWFHSKRPFDHPLSLSLPPSRKLNQHHSKLR